MAAPRRLVGTLVATAVVAVAAAGIGASVVLVRDHVHPTSSTAGGQAPAAAGADGDVTGHLAHPLTGKNALFFGDSFTSGYGSHSPRTDGYAPLTASALGWTAQTAWDAGGGYVTRGDKGLTFQQRFEQVPSTPTPDVVVLEGGLNDHDATDMSAVGPAYTALVHAIQARWPGVDIVTLGPVASTTKSAAGVQQVDAQLKAAAATDGMPYVDATSWFTTDPVAAGLINVDAHNHPDDAGYQVIARNLTAAIRTLEGSAA